MIYVLHFERPYHHARHYVGFAEHDVENRVREQLTSTGRRPSPLVRAVVAAGIGVVLAAVIEGTREDERKIKRGAKTSSVCPHCREAYLTAARERMRRVRASKKDRSNPLH
jgi:hypothetical protein